MEHATFLDAAQFRQLLLNGHETAGRDSIDPMPVVKLFTPDANATWLLTELDPDNEDTAFGLCDLGLGFPELGYVSLPELATLRGPLGLPVEVDSSFVGTAPLSVYAEAARKAGRIVALPTADAPATPMEVLP